MARRQFESTFEDELGCLSYCVELDGEQHPLIEQEDINAAADSRTAAEHSAPTPTPLYFCLSPNCVTPSSSAADHPAICHRLSISGTLCDEPHLDRMAVSNYPLEKFPIFDESMAQDLDLEEQMYDRSQPLPRPTSTKGWSGRYQSTLWFLSTRPRDSLFVLLGVLIAFVATLALALLVFLMVAEVRGNMGAVIASVDTSLAWIHQTIIGLLQAFDGSLGSQGSPASTLHGSG